MEGGLGWIPSLRRAHGQALVAPAQRSAASEAQPSEYISEQVWFTTQPMEEPGTRLATDRPVRPDRLGSPAVLDRLSALGLSTIRVTPSRRRSAKRSATSFSMAMRKAFYGMR
jgi:hypothetical protein